MFSYFNCTELTLSTVHGVCLPGRESRFVEPFIVDDWKSLLKDFCKDVHGILKEKPFAFWGHRFVLYNIILSIKLQTLSI